MSSTTSEQAVNRNDAPLNQSKFGNKIAVVFGSFVFLVCAVGSELVLRFFFPISDPYASFKTTTPLNQYIKSEFSRNFQMTTYSDEGLPGLSGSHTFTTNNLGFRGEFLQRPKPADEFRVFIVGGSTTECWFLDDSQSLSRMIQNELTAHVPNNVKVRVYGAGKSGDAIDDHVSMIVHRIIHLQPNLIVVFAGINDLTRSIYNYNPLHFMASTKTMLSTRELAEFVATDFQIPRRLYYLFKPIFSTRTSTEILHEIPLKSNIKEKVELRKSTPVSNAKPRTDPQAYQNNLETIVGVTKQGRVGLVFMTQQTTWTGPDPKSKEWHWILYRGGVTYREGNMNEALESLNDVMREVGIGNDVPVYDLAHSIPKTSQYFYDDVHFNVEGARWAGTNLASFMLTKEPLRHIVEGRSTCVACDAR